jgi:zinc transporter ZupT
VQEEVGTSSKSTTLQAQEENLSETSKTVFHTLFLVATLSVHSFFEGLAIGLLQPLYVVLPICAAVLIHKVSPLF